MRVAPRAVGQLFRNKDSKGLGQSGDTIVEVLIALSIISLMLVGAFMVTHQSTAVVQDTQEHMQALSIANAQLEFLSQRVKSGVEGLSVDQSCFNADGTASDSTGTECSYDANGRSGCKVTAASYCYTVKLTPHPEPVDDTANSPTQNVNYDVEVTWKTLLDGREGKTKLTYKVAEANPGYIPPIGSDALGNASIGAAPCTGSHCGGGSLGKYSFGTGVLNNTFSVPKNLIKECMWDFQDANDPPVWRDPLTDPQAKCYEGEVKLHSYAGAPEMQGLKPYPIACYPSGSAPAGATGEGNHKYTITLTIRLIDGRIVKTPPASVVIAHAPFCP